MGMNGLWFVIAMYIKFTMMRVITCKYDHLKKNA